jgi:uncharacterized protein (TIGR02466 family)
MNINYNFYLWGAFLFRTKILDKEVKKILSFCKKDKKLDCRHNLAGHLSQEFLLKKEDISPVLLPYMNAYIKARHQHMNTVFKGTIEMDRVWVNYMKQGEFNPPHIHKFDLSCVLYLQIPRDIFKNKENHVAKSAIPGSISFNYGENLKNNTMTHSFFPETGDFFVFPAWLQHYVFPFKSKEERISLSANFKEINTDRE